MTMITIDATEKIEVEHTQHFNEIKSLKTQLSGLKRLAETLKRRELHFHETQGKHLAASFVFGLDYDGTRENLDLIACTFHWFGVSLCNYAQLVGFLRGLVLNHFIRADLKDAKKFSNIKKSVKAYVNSITELASVLVWRNKVSAHYAITDPRDDNIATLDMSVIFPVTFTNGLYVVGGQTLIRTNASGTHTSALPMWSMTKVFESLMPRFWPDMVGPNGPVFEQMKPVDSESDFTI